MSVFLVGHGGHHGVTGLVCGLRMLCFGGWLGQDHDVPSCSEVGTKGQLLVSTLFNESMTMGQLT